MNEDANAPKAAAPISLLPANEEVSEAELGLLLSAVRIDALYAHQRCEEENNPLAKHLKPIVDVLSSHNIVVSYELGDSGFRVDEATGEIQFNGNALNSIVTAARSMSPRGDDDASEAFTKLAVALYIYHEITHVVQKFIDHALAGKIKQVLSPDQLSQFDCVADVTAAHASAIISCAYAGNFSEEYYLDAYASNLLLSYQVLVRAFGIAKADHKRKRALGLLTNVSIAQLALSAKGEARAILMSLCIRPCFTGVDEDNEEILCITLGPDGPCVLFCGGASTNTLNVKAMWAALGQYDPSEIVALLRLAYERHSAHK